MHENAFCAAVR